MSSVAFDFDSRKGRRLSGRIERPEQTPRAWAIMAHCFTCGKDGLAATRVARALAQAGIGVLRFDFAGIGRSEGEFADGNFAGDVEDLVTASEAMAAQGMAPSLLVGHSLGGAAVLMAADRLPAIRAVATIAAPADVDHILRQFDAAALDRIEKEGEAEIVLANRPFVFRRSFVEDIRSHDLPAAVARLGRPLLVLHAPRDAVVGIDNATRIFMAAKHPKSFVSLDDADHLLLRQSDADYAAGVIAAWAGRYISAAVDAGAPMLEDATSGIVAQETRQGLFQLDIHNAKHRLIADEPVAQGGMDSGFSPYDLLCAALGACTTMTMRLYARHKGFKLDHARTIVEHVKRTDAMPADLFTRSIRLEGDLDDEQRQRILAIADRCPVDITLTLGSAIETHLEARDPS
ncbi:MAG TPA: alpha/beta fold hydrolase [Stellaceae bacterium]|jgi:putative redox protein|nr:alpha/beta fold hydrolase [Stellaceae bacterium]